MGAETAVGDLVGPPTLLVLGSQAGEVPVESRNPPHHGRFSVPGVVPVEVVREPDVTETHLVSIGLSIIEVDLVADAHVGAEVVVAEAVSRVVAVVLRYVEVEVCEFEHAAPACDGLFVGPATESLREANALHALRSRIQADSVVVWPDRLERSDLLTDSAT